MSRLLFYLLLLLPFGIWAVEKSHYVLVSVAPHRYFVERIAGGSVKVGLLVPAGADSHTYEPTPKQVLEACRADAWFMLGEQFEKRASGVIRERNPGIRLVDLRQGIDLIQESHCHHCQCTEGADPHIWLSVRLAKKQAETIAHTLEELYPENRERYAENLETFKSQLDQLDKEMMALFTEQAPKVIVVGHPAYAYFCRDYGLKQVSIETEGRDPSPQQLTKLLENLRKEKIQTIFTQPQYNDKGAKLIAKQLGIKVVKIDPYPKII